MSNDPSPAPSAPGPMGRIVASLENAWHARELVYFFAWRDVKVRYKQALLGAAWAILQPLLSMIVFTLVFGRIAGVPSDGLPYSLFAYTGLVLWSYFSGVVGTASQCLIANSNLITKVYFPRLALPVSNIVSALIDFAIGVAFLAVLMIWYRVAPTAPAILAPLFVLQLIVLTVGCSLFLASLNVAYRDVKYAVPLMMQLWLFATPVIYPMSAVPEEFRLLMALNPMAGIVDGMRNCLLLGQWPDPALTSISCVVSLLALFIGLAYFRRTEKSFADII